MEITAAAQWLNSTFAGFDYAIMEFFHNLHEGALGFIINPFLYFITLLGNEGTFLIILGLVLLLFKKSRKVGAAILLGLLFGSLITNVTVKPLVARPRPYIDETSVFYDWWVTAGSHLEGEKSFPSGHTTSAMAAMTGLFFVTNKKVSWTAFIFAILMGFSRIIICVHYPSDVLGGLIVGFVAGFLAALLVNAFYKNTDGKIKSKVVNFDLLTVFKKKA